MDRATNKKLIDFIGEVAKKYSNFSTAYLFGSYAKGTENEDSDIDVALLFEDLKAEDKFDLQVQLMLAGANFDSRIEPHPISKEVFELGSPYISEISKNGIEILPSSLEV
ncbi:nucleotidyltransferase domain-containing protein [Marivirga sp.]|uniref:nucleotidyltransferase domain-containing protein n=1 Tax=Marivirga sp. TaxID=2018662 RepID=UPI002D7E55C0|nr:nucleotidyltransferase domain-containing protein [Marivirga sp.]HET8861562.1 nucleotidyltransferase domain-containing protein [Marivirga sp.]